MGEIKVGDHVIFVGVVKVMTISVAHVLVETEAGYSNWLPKKELQLVEPPPFSVGDRVTIDATGQIGTIDRIDEYPYHVSDYGWFQADTITPAPPKPEYHVVRKDDTIGVQRIESDMPPIWLGRVYMSDPEVVETAIVEWATVYRIDADAARELAAEPQIIGRHEIHGTAYATAIRHGGAWSVYVTANTWQNVDSATRNGTLQPKHIGEAIFQEIEGPYKE